MAYAKWLPILLGFLTAIGPLTTDMYLPAFPAIEAGLHTPMGSAQITLAAWFVGLAVGQMTQGVLADRFGRRLPLIIGTIIYVVANTGCALAPSLFWLSAFRFVAAVGGSASMVIPRAIVRDLAEGHAAARMMSRLILVMGAAPILAPSLGSLVLGLAGWQVIFWVLTVYGALSCALVCLLLPDTLPPERRVRLDVAEMASRSVQILRDRGFLMHVLMGGAGMFAMFGFIGGAPGAFIDGYHLGPSLFAAVFGMCAACFIVISQFNPMALARFGTDRVLFVSVRVFFGAAVTLGLLTLLPPLFGVQAPWWLLVPCVMTCMGCQGFNMPNAAVGALARHAAHAGTASALMGMMQFGLAATSGVFVGAMADGTMRPVALVMICGSAGAVLAERFRRR